eukprot:TRINITY_DN23489_c0_g1_i1.p3 TRINITY_DN23489_c0_g1~~TRINITY_DN23489_c0_g1_i1.p3  ORF type:complete len:246 (+),score=50.16 TRINITY_DN23489_c0_g1_i1:96-833(+)
MGRRVLLRSDLCRINTAATALVELLHVLFCIINYIGWVRHERGESLSSRTAGLYLAFTLIATVSYLLVTSVLHTWAFRWPLPDAERKHRMPDHARRRRMYGVITNLVLSDAPLFGINVHLAWSTGVVSSLQAVTLVFSIVSFAAGGVRSWVYLMTHMIQAAKPHHEDVASMVPHLKVRPPGFQMQRTAPQWPPDQSAMRYPPEQRLGPCGARSESGLHAHHRQGPLGRSATAASLQHHLGSPLSP